MLLPKYKKINYILTSTNHGALIVNRNDFIAGKDDNGNYFSYGVGHDLLESSFFNPFEIQIGFSFLDAAIQKNQNLNLNEEIIAIDCGSNIGVHTVEWGNFLTGFGKVISIEAQEKVYYALAGNIAIHNLFNVKAINAAVGSENKVIKIPSLDYSKPSSFGSFEIKKTENTEQIGQLIDYENNLSEINQITIDSLNLSNLHFMKIDIEGMEMEALKGAKETIKKFHPYLMIESIKSPKEQIEEFLISNDYDFFFHHINIFAAHKADPFLNVLKEKLQKNKAEE